MYIKFTQFLSAFGTSVTMDNLGETLTTVFANPERTLVGKTLNVEIGYDGNHVEYRGKDDAGIKKYVLVFKDGSVLSDASGREITFPDMDSALARAEANQIDIQRFVNVLSYAPSASTTTGGNW
jgi:hypothetical protein